MSKQILLVEDDPDILFIIEHILTQDGYTVSTSVDGQGILEKVKEVNPDLVLMDIRLPNADGRILCSNIKEHKKELPVILMSAHIDYTHSFSEVLADDFIAKPFNIDNLLKRIEKQLLF